MTTCVRCAIFDVETEETAYCEGCTNDIVQWLFAAADADMHEVEVPEEDWCPTEEAIEAMVAALADEEAVREALLEAAADEWQTGNGVY